MPLRKGHSKHSRYLRALMAALLVVAAACALPACKFSDTIAEFVPDMAAAVDTTMPHVDKADTDGKQDTQGAAQHKSGEEDTSDIAAVAYDPDAEDSKFKSAKVEYDAEQAQTDTQPSAGGEKRAEEKDTSGLKSQKTAGGKSGEDGSGSGSGGTGSGNGGDGGDGEGKGAGSGSGSGSGSSEQAAPSVSQDEDDDNKTEVPSGKRIAATGETANIVQMLTGELRKEQLDAGQEGDYLVATDEAFQDGVASAGVYPGEGVDEAVLGWKRKNGTEKGGVDVEALKKAKVDLVVYESNTATLTESDVDALGEAGIKVLAVSSLTQDSDICDAVEQVAEALSRGAGAKAKKAISSKAASWEDFHDGLLNSVTRLNDGWSVAYAHNTHDDKRFVGYDFDWVSTAKNATGDHKLTLVCPRVVSVGSYPSLEKLGYSLDTLLAVPKSWFASPCYHYLSAAGVVDNAQWLQLAKWVRIIKSEVAHGRLVEHNPYAIDDSSWSYSISPSRYRVVVPVFTRGESSSVRASSGLESGESLDFSLNTYGYVQVGDLPSYVMGNYCIEPYVDWENYSLHTIRNIEDVEDDSYFLGSDHFPAVVVETEEQKESVQAAQDDRTSMYWFADNLREWRQLYTDGSSSSEKLDAMNPNASLLAGKFDVYVAPSGVLGSWLEGGSHESFLLSAWARSAYYGDYSSSKAQAKARSYYGEFYRAEGAAPDMGRG
jgi:hypothetical protein